MDTKCLNIGLRIAIIAVLLLGLFLGTKVVTEVLSWSKDTIYPVKTITINAEGEALAVADIASFNFSVSEDGATSAEAQTKATDKINKTLDYLKKSGVEDKDVKTENYSINPKYSNGVPCYTFNCPITEPKIIGYTVSQSILVKVQDTANAGTFLSELTKFGINNVSGISFTTDDKDVLYDKARADAIEKAKVKAEILAKELGVKLGKVISFNEDMSGGYSGDLGMGGAEMGVSFKSAAPQIPVGENKYTSRVYVTYELK